MFKLSKLLLLSTIMFLILAACGGTTSSTEPPVEDSVVEEPMTGEHTDTAASDESMAEESMAEESMAEEPMAEEPIVEESMAEEPIVEESMAESDDGMEAETVDVSTDVAEWLTFVLEDARTGDQFTLADFSGKTVYVEPMATWCTNCRRQLNELSAGQDQLPADTILIGLSVEPNLPNDVLAGYANGQGYDFLFAVGTPELIEGIVGQYGRSAVNPPSTPHFLIRPDGTISDLSTGHHTIEEIITQIQQESQ
jgi:hypothetical protein